MSCTLQVIPCRLWLDGTSRPYGTPLRTAQGCSTRRKKAGALVVQMRLWERQDRSDVLGIGWSNPFVWLPTRRAMRNGAKSREAWRCPSRKGHSASFSLARHAQALQPEQQQVRDRALRSARYWCLRGVERLRCLQSMGNGQWICRQPVSGPHRQRVWPFRRKLSLGRSNYPGSKPKEFPLHHASGRNQDTVGVVRIIRIVIIRSRNAFGTWLGREASDHHPGEIDSKVLVNVIRRWARGLCQALRSALARHPTINWHGSWRFGGIWRFGGVYFDRQTATEAHP